MSRTLCALYLIASFLFLGCAADHYRASDSHGSASAPIVTALADKAALHEDADEIQLAMICWRGILEIEPENTGARANLQRLENTAAERARSSYLIGKAALAQTRPKDARRALLLTLRLDPQFEDARQRLYQFMNPPVFTWYRLQPGESLQDLSRKFFGTPDGADLIAYLNYLPVNAEILVPRMLRIPTLAARPPYQTQKTDHDLARARKLSKAGRHEKVLVLTERLRRANPKLRDAVRIENESRFVLGQSLYQQQQYLKANEMLDGISGSLPGLEPLRAKLKVAMKRQAEVYYRDGVKYFLNDELQRAVESWRLTLAMDPEHQSAAASIREAETLLQKLKTADEE